MWVINISLHSSPLLWQWIDGNFAYRSARLCNLHHYFTGQPLWVLFVQFKGSNKVEGHEIASSPGLQLPGNQGFKLETQLSSETTQLCTLGRFLRRPLCPEKALWEGLYSTTTYGTKGRVTNRSKLMTWGSQLAQFKQENFNTLKN